MKLFTRKPKGKASVAVKEIVIVEGNEDTILRLPSFPTGCPFISIITSGKFSVLKGQEQHSAHSYLSGQFLTPFMLEMPLEDRALNIQIKPLKLPLIFRQNPFEFYDKQIPLELINLELTRRLEDCLASSQKSENVLDSVEKIMDEVVSFNRCPDERASAAWWEILHAKGDIRIMEVSDHVSLSPRRLQQIFKESIGITAKGFARIARLQNHTLRSLKGSDKFSFMPDSYFDQAHFIHDVAQQTGMTPTEFAKFLGRSPHKFAYVKSNLFSQYQ